MDDEVVDPVFLGGIQLRRIPIPSLSFLLKSLTISANALSYGVFLPVLENLPAILSKFPPFISSICQFLIRPEYTGQENIA
jgi:hypothetical protein